MTENTYNFNISNWSAWMLGELSRLENMPQIKYGEPLLENISPMVKRRMPKLSKYIYDMDQSVDLEFDAKDVPIVFASKNAELCRTFKIIRSFDTDVSPAQFSMSVHNAIAGLLSVIKKNNSVYTVIDSLSGPLEAAIIEAVSLLYEHKTVKIIYFDEDLPVELLNSYPDNNKPVVLMLLIQKGHNFSLVNEPNTGKDSESLSQLLELLSLKANTYRSSIGRTTWNWKNNAKT